jgi:hypothetical protein
MQTTVPLECDDCATTFSVMRRKPPTDRAAYSLNSEWLKVSLRHPECHVALALSMTRVTMIIPDVYDDDGVGIDSQYRATCGAPECGKEFEFEDRETRVFELPPSIFERGHFYRLNCGIRDCSVDSRYASSALASFRMAMSRSAIS